MAKPARTVASPPCRCAPKPCPAVPASGAPVPGHKRDRLSTAVADGFVEASRLPWGRQAPLSSRSRQGRSVRLHVGATSVILQTEAAECGLACIAMIASHYGHRMDLPAIRRRFSASMTARRRLRNCCTVRFLLASCTWPLGHCGCYLGIRREIAAVPTTSWHSVGGLAAITDKGRTLTMYRAFCSVNYCCSQSKCGALEKQPIPGAATLDDRLAADQLTAAVPDLRSCMMR
ncbi:hypothetical protein DPM13_09240 [Paracoccus mutanolyticus]|uniref:Peptidase C39 domain-containing protein n=1 Tax=Paracoccus mutanolyticus TaxID=1499308 RepID=A0ABM6WRE8_9RHOB|nr:hypothetical protein DPM13_09240 [Paracoccus mutanolyticus]